MTLVGRYSYLAPALPNNFPYTESVPGEDLVELRKQTTKILSNIYDDVDTSNEKCISITNKNLRRKVDVVFGFWYNTEEYVKYDDETYRGIKFKASGNEVDYPFLHMRNVNNKGELTNDGSRKGIRLLKTLKADSENELSMLKGFQFTTIVHNIGNANLYYSPGKEINIAQAISGQLNLLIHNSIYRKSIVSPNGMEYPFTNDDIVSQLKILKEELDTLIEDSSKEIVSSQRLQKAYSSY